MTNLTAALLVVIWTHGAERAQTPVKPLVISHCIVALIDEAQVPAKKAGLIASVAVEEGAAVRAGDLLAQIDDSEVRIGKKIAQREFEVAAKEAANDINVRFSAAVAAVAKAEVEAAVEVNAKIPGTVAAAEVRRLRLDQHRSELGIEQAKQQFEVARITATVREAHVEAADLEIASRRVTSSIDGVVVRVHRHEGDWANLGDPICHVIRLDRLRVTGFVNVREYEQEQVFGSPVKVAVRLASGRVETFDGKIGFTSPLVEAGGEYRVWAEIENRQRNGFWSLRPGLIAEMSVELAAGGDRVDDQRR